MADVLLTYNPTRQGCDISFVAGDVALDVTPVSALLMSLLAEGRARPGDVLPFSPPPLARNAPLGAWRRGWPGDALDALGRFIGSRLWLLARAANGAGTLALARSLVASAVSWVQTERGIPVQVTVAWQTPTLLAYRVSAGGVTLSNTLGVG